MIRTAALFALALMTLACNTLESCRDRPTDPFCQEIDSGISEAGPNDTGTGDTGGDVDAHVPCGGSCSGTTSHCLTTPTEMCVGCRDDGDCSGATSRCELTGHTCVACLDETTCTLASASRCDTDHTCQACTASTDCTHLTGTPTCDTSTGTCVACLTNADCDATHGCDLATHACVSFSAMSAATCDTCVRDAECHTGQLCVPMMFDDPTTTATDPVPAGNHCLWRQDATGAGAPNGDCTTFRPYIGARAMTSVDGVMTTVCTLRDSTCEAHADFNMTNCMTLDPDGDARCGQSALADAACQMFGTTTNRCTVFCFNDDDCPGTTCAAGPVPRLCAFP